MKPRSLLLILVSALALTMVAAAGASGRTAKPPRDCGQSTGRGPSPISSALTVYTDQKGFDCLRGAYRAGCKAAVIRAGQFGVDLSFTYRLRIHRVAGRCRGSVALLKRFSLVHRKLDRHEYACRSLTVSQRYIFFRNCGKADNVVLTLTSTP